MRQLKQLHDAVKALDLSGHRQDSNEIVALKFAMKSASKFLFTTKSFEYVGKLTSVNSSAVIKMPNIDMDFDDMIRMVADCKSDLNVDVEMSLVLFSHGETSVGSIVK